MVQPRHHNHLNLLTRWTRMLAAPAGDWSVLQQICADPWEAFQHAHPRYQTPYYHGLVGKMLACGTPVKIGSMEYRGLHCGQGKHVVALRCTSGYLLKAGQLEYDCRYSTMHGMPVTGGRGFRSLKHWGITVSRLKWVPRDCKGLPGQHKNASIHRL